MSVERPQLNLILGKGGTGKSSVTAAFGMAAARAGVPTLVIELAERAVIPEMLGAPPARDEPREIMPGLSAFSIDPEAEAERHLRENLAIGPLIARLTRSGALAEFARAAPGVAELVSLDRVWALAGDARWSRTLVDLPSTGHALALLGAPADAAVVAAGGPLGERAAPLDAALRDPAVTSLKIVTIPTELAVAEAIDAVGALREMGLPEPSVVLNRMQPGVFHPEEAAALEAVAAQGGPEGDVAARAVDAIRRRAHDERLRRELRMATGIDTLTELPALPGEVDADGLWALAAASLESPA